MITAYLHPSVTYRKGGRSNISVFPPQCASCVFSEAISEHGARAQLSVEVTCVLTSKPPLQIPILRAGRAHLPLSTPKGMPFHK